MSRNADGLGRKPHKWRDRWRAYLTIGYKLDGTPDRLYVYGRTQAECLQKLDEARRKVADGHLVKAPPETVSAYLEAWLEQKALEVKPRTVTIYRRDLAPVLETLGRRKLAKLKPADVQAMMRHVVGRKRTFRTSRQGRPRTVTLTAKTANAARGTLSNALDDAVALGLIPTNPVARVKSLKHEPQPVQVWTADQVMRFTNETRAAGADYHALFYLALTAGLRAGELIALEWGDIRNDLLHVRRSAGTDGILSSPKTTAGTRVLPLSSDTVEALQAHRAGLASAGLAGHLVFPTGNGTMVTHSNLRRSLHAWADRAGVPRIRPHDLRHTYASMAIASGMDVAELARRLGHVNAAFTLRQYVHFFEAAAARRAPTLAELTGFQNRKGVQPGGTSPDPPPN